MKRQPNDGHPYAVDIDLSNCDNEPIHLIPYIQDHACLLACEADSLCIIHASKNLKEKIGFTYTEVLHKSLEAYLDPFVFYTIQQALAQKTDLKEINPIRVGFNVEEEYHSYNLLVHQHKGRLLLEFEPYDAVVTSTSYQYKLSKAIRKIQQAKDLNEAYNISAREIRRLTGYDRVMVYRFDDAGNGQVIAEDKKEEIEPFLGLHYPASDIPKQARALFLINKVRIMSDVNGENASIHPPLDKKDKKPLDLTLSVTRGVSPIHLEYLRNMGVEATMSIAIENDHKLWGMFACHHYAPKFIDYNLRSTCEFLGQILSGHLSLQAADDFRKTILEINIRKSQLFEQMSSDWNIIKGLVEQKVTILNLFDCTGACILSEGTLVSLGNTPGEPEIRALAKWLDEHSKAAYFQTNHLSKVYPQASSYTDTAAGVLAIRIMPEISNYVMWFRAEVTQEVLWAGDPREKDEGQTEGMRLTPRKSFARWKEMVHGKSPAWQRFEWETALGLRNDIKDFIYKKYKEIKDLNRELTKAYNELESFSYSVSHDLRAPLRNINGFAQILLEDYVDQLDSDGKGLVHTIVDSTDRMNDLINDILAFSKIGRSKLIINELKLSDFAQSMYDELVLWDSTLNKNNTKLILHDTDLKVYADAVLFKQLLHNLISNAVKYSAFSDVPTIEVGGKRKGDQVLFYVKDNGIGFNMKYKEQVFKVFTRLVNDEKYSGNGVGLAIVKRIVDQHEGFVDIDSKEGEGTTFFITLPVSVEI